MLGLHLTAERVFLRRMMMKKAKLEETDAWAVAGEGIAGGIDWRVGGDGGEDGGGEDLSSANAWGAGAAGGVGGEDCRA